MIALSFLGLGQYNKETETYSYQKTKYSFHKQYVETEYFPYAVSEFIKPEKFFVIMTEKAEKTHSILLKNLCDFNTVKIPDGKSEKEFWMIFDKITETISEGDEVVFDITHGFRSQPFIVIVLLLYLKALKNIKINNILYGAFEAKDENNITPVFELKPFVDLIDWSNAVREFTENGNMKYFKTLLSEIHKNSYLNKLPNPSQQLKGAGEDLSKLTDAFATIRLKEIFQNTFNFNKRIKNLKNDFENNLKSKPFENLIDKIVSNFEIITKAEKDIFSDKGFEAQKSIMQWYIETNKYQKAITLAREFIISKYLVEILKANPNCLLEKGCRIESENELGSLSIISKSGMDSNDRKSEYGKLWVKITEMRNDINHAGMRKNPNPSEKLIQNIKRVIEKILQAF